MFFIFQLDTDEQIDIFSDFILSFMDKLSEIAYKKEQRRKKEFWHNISPSEFEKEVAIYYHSKGYIVHPTRISRDGGVDIIAEKDETITYIQCKHYKENINVHVVRELGGVMLQKRAGAGAIACINGITKEAKKYCSDVNIKELTINTFIRYYNTKPKKQPKEAIIPFRDQFKTPFPEIEVNNYYVYGKIFDTLETACKECESIEYHLLANGSDAKAVIRHKNHYFIIYSSSKKIEWLGDYILCYTNANSRCLIPPRRIQ